MSVRSQEQTLALPKEVEHWSLTTPKAIYRRFPVLAKVQASIRGRVLSRDRQTFKSGSKISEQLDYINNVGHAIHQHYWAVFNVRLKNSTTFIRESFAILRSGLMLTHPPFPPCAKRSRNSVLWPCESHL